MKKTYKKPLLQAEALVAEGYLAADFNIVFSDGQDVYDDFPDDEE